MMNCDLKISSCFDFTPFTEEELTQYIEKFEAHVTPLTRVPEFVSRQVHEQLNAVVFECSLSMYTRVSVL